MNDLGNFLLPNEPTCIVACSASAARLWKSTTRFGDWQELTAMQHPEGTQREANYASDRPGRSFNSFGSGRHAMSQPRSGQNHELSRFAEAIADYINRAIIAHDFAYIVLIAEPRMLGYLREKLSRAARAAIVKEASKNVAHLAADQIREYFK